jgi:small nuclear ribonucleoprotein B and B'
MLSLVLWRIRVTLNDNRQLVGQMLAFDRHMNLVIAECEEFRRVKPKKKGQNEDEGAPSQDLKRSLGLVILRGEMIVSLAVEGPPPIVDEDKKTAGVRAFPQSHRVRWDFTHLPLFFIAVTSWSWARWARWTRNGNGNDASE